MRTPNWQEIAKSDFVLEDSCWKTCNGGFCCSNGHPDFKFRLLPTQGTTIIYMGPEYDWVKIHGRVPKTQSGTEAAQLLQFDFGGPAPLRIYHVTCRLLGLCAGKVDKPLLCK